MSGRRTVIIGSEIVEAALADPAAAAIHAVMNVGVSDAKLFAHLR